MTISSLPGPSPTHVHHDRRRRRRLCLPCCLISVAIALAVAITLAFTLLRFRDPKTTLVSAQVSGVSPRITFPAVRVELNISMDLDLLVHNPNRASFEHHPGKTQLFYRGARVGDADVAAGRIPSRGSEHVRVRLTVEAGELAGELGELVADVMAGEVGFDASTRLSGRVTLLGFIKHHAVATSECHVAVGFPDLEVRSQQCSQKTKL